MQMLLRAFVALPLILTLTPTPLWAFEVLRASGSNAPVHWEALVIPYEVAENPGEVDPDAAIAAVRGAADAWEEVGCHSIHFVYQGPPEEEKAAIDGHNRVLWIHEQWPGTPAELAITTVTRSTSTGRIADTDLLLNDVAYSFSLAETPLDTEIPLLGVLTHEWGHVLGLAHSDANESTMTEFVLENVEELASLEADDRVGLCSLYEPVPIIIEESEDDSAAVLPTPTESRQAETTGFAWAFAALIVLFLLGRRSFPPLLFVIILCCTEGTDPLTDTEVIDGETADVDGVDDIDLPPDADDSSDQKDELDSVDASTFQPVDLAGLLADNPTWRVVRWESADQVLAGDEVITSWENPDARTLRFAFGEDGVLREYFGDDPIVENRGCTMAGSWSLEDGMLVWRWRTTATYCPGEAPLREETLLATFDPAENALRLELHEARWSLGNTETTLRPYRIFLTPESSPTLSTQCAELPPPPPCDLSCDLLESGSAVVPGHTLSCAPPSEVKSCNSLTNPDTGDIIQQVCHRGCYTIACSLDYDAEGEPFGGCDAGPGNLTCTYAE